MSDGRCVVRDGSNIPVKFRRAIWVGLGGWGEVAADTGVGQWCTYLPTYLNHASWIIYEDEEIA